MNLAKSLTFLGNFGKGIKIYHFSSEIIFGQLSQTFGDFFLVTLLLDNLTLPAVPILTRVRREFDPNNKKNHPFHDDYDDDAK